MNRRPRLIPVLLLDSARRLVKTVNFGERTYIGDPINVVRLFNEKEVDEICVLDIDASREGREPNFGFLRELASECFMPLAYGGGITAVDQCDRLCRDGVEKLVLGSQALNHDLLRAISRDLGSQAVVACIDVRGGSSGKCFIRNARQDTSLTPFELCRKVEDAGAGEIILQSVDRDGTRTGFDLELIRTVAARSRVPIVALGGAGGNKHLASALAAGSSAAASGSAFSFIGRLRAVLISYPDHADISLMTPSEMCAP